jgi:tripartite-type tricarboxylate transporter receptor subunit TctC
MEARNTLHRPCAGISRRAGLGAVLVLAAVLSGGIAGAQSKGTVTIVVPFAAGGGVDTVTRAIAEKLSAKIGKPVLVDNRPGASTMLAVEHVARSPADGSVFLVGTPSLSTNQALQPAEGPGDPRKLLKPVLPIARQPYVLIAGPALPKEVTDVASLIKWAAANPGALDMVNSGPLTAPRLAAELLAFRTNTPIVTISYKSGNAGVLDVAGGRVHGGFTQVIEAMPQMTAGNVRALAVSSLKRSPVFPDIPAVAETVADFDVTSWNGLFAPAETPDAVVAAMNKAMNEVLKNEELRARFRNQGTEFVGGTSAELAQVLDREIRGWENLNAKVKLKLE